MDGEEEVDSAYIGEGDSEEVIEIHLENVAAAADIDELDLNDDELEEEVRPPPERDDAVVVFSRHTSEVYCLDIDPATSSLVVSGGGDDVAYVWRLTDGEVLFQCTGHRESVNLALFNHDSSLVVTVDLAGLIKVWNVARKEQVWSYEVDGDTEMHPEAADGDDNSEDEPKEDVVPWVEWHSKSSILLAGTRDGTVWMWVVPSAVCKTFPSPGVSSTAGKFTADGKRACVGYKDGTVKVWDLKTTSCLHTVVAGAGGHESEVVCIDCHGNNKVVLTGAADSSVLLINTDTGKVTEKLKCHDDMTSDADLGSEVAGVEAVAFSPSGNFAATATTDGLLTIWDRDMKNPRHHCRHQAGITRLLWHASVPLVYTCTLDGVVCLWDGRSGSLQSTWLGHSDRILDMKLSRDGTKLATASEDSTVRVFNVQVPPTR